jgi:succinate-acetate transporter protein
MSSLPTFSLPLLSASRYHVRCMRPVANSILGLVVTAQWELSVGNGFAYTVFSAFGLFYAGYGAILTPAFGVEAAYGDNVDEYNNALGFFMISQLLIAAEMKAPLNV